MTSFLDYLLSTTRVQIPRPPSDFTEIARVAVSEAPETVIHESFADAYKVLRTSKDRGQIGKRGDYRRRHIAYAWAPMHNGKRAVHVLHATKGWKILHGVSA